MGALALLLGAAGAPAQTALDVENRYPSVGAIMVWRVDDPGKPIQLRGFASGTLIRPAVMLTAGHFTAPTKALGGLPPALRMFASFSAMDALGASSKRAAERLVANVSDGGRNCRRHNNHNRLDTRAIQKLIDDTIKAHEGR